MNTTEQANPQPYVTADLPGIGGRIKERVEDFRVEEIPLYEACGEGTHVYFTVIKRGVPTPVAADRIARYMGVNSHDIGVAGLKDAQAVTVQRMSLEHADEKKLAAYKDPQIEITATTRHTNKLRPGHLAGNRFLIRIRGVGAGQVAAAQAVLDRLAKRGVPNYFGHQRFGARNDTALLGAAMVRGDLAEFVALLLGRALPSDPPDCKAARDAFDAGFCDRALNRWPRHYYNERRALAAYKHKLSPKAAFDSADKRMKRLYVSAFQGGLFNEVLARRIDTLDQVFAGDLAQKTDSGGVFRVEDQAVEQPRADRFEISPTGPLFGYRSNLAEGPMGELEQSVLAARNLQLDDFRRVGALKVKGGRRPLRFAILQPSLAADQDGKGDFIKIGFAAPSGCYATVVLREIMKSDAAPTEAADEPEELTED